MTENGIWNVHNNISVKISDAKNISNICAQMRKYLPTCEYYFNAQCEIDMMRLHINIHFNYIYVYLLFIINFSFANM